jgi:protein-L-isoaspartate(D-aspartate) O-methyltransferase
VKRIPLRSISMAWFVLLGSASLAAGYAPSRYASSAKPKSESDLAPAAAPGPGHPPPTHASYAKAREEMVRTTIESRGIGDRRVLQAMRAEPREDYLPEEKRSFAYQDTALKIGWEQTISRPFIVALMSSLLAPQPDSRVLEIGTGSGYQAAILDHLAKAVYSIEIVEPLCKRARANLDRLGHDRVRTRCGDGYLGWPEAAPFDRIILTAAPPEIPQALIDQLKPGGRLVAPVGKEAHDVLVILEKRADGTVARRVQRGVAFVPMVHARNEQPTGWLPEPR